MNEAVTGTIGIVAYLIFIGILLFLSLLGMSDDEQ